jgi:two-component sensor histidine kinase
MSCIRAVNCQPSGVRVALIANSMGKVSPLRRRASTSMRRSRTSPSALCTFTDETRYLAALGQAQLLNNELSHRIKNLLATIQAIAAQTFGASGLRDTFEQRLTALAAAHDLITSKGWSGSLDALVRTALEPFLAGGRIAIEGPAVELDDTHAVPFALALHELATNAAKYGALSTPQGRVEISWRLEADGALDFCWRERGGPPVIAPQRRGFGSRMIERSLARELKGAVVLDFQPQGLVCAIRARPRPLSDHAEPASSAASIAP